VPLSATAVATIRGIVADKARLRGAIHLLVKQDGARYGDMKKEFTAACRRAKISGLRWHDLRHTFASWFVQAGADLYHLSRMFGHSTVQMSSRYGHLRNHDLHLALERAAQNRPQVHLIGDAV
jgi:site-specific recombinase XerD